MRNLLFKIAFDGSAFHGWQQQENAVTVQGELKDAFYRLCGENANIINYRNAIVNEYSTWEEELSQREHAVREKERELGISSY